MRLPIPNMTLQESLEEFDIWITPSLGEIQDTQRFKEELDRIVSVFKILDGTTDGFSTVEACEPQAIARGYVAVARDSPAPESCFHALASTLFLVSGKSDNNAKCQLPIYLRDRARFVTFPRARRNGVSEGPMPRELRSDKYMSVVAALGGQESAQVKLLEAFIGFVLSDQRYNAQLWSVGRCYVAMRALGRERDLLSPLVAFQVRGSVAASGGHDPEEMLRTDMADWGMVPGKDYNTSDAPVGSGEATDDVDQRVKKRAYDFVLPFMPDVTGRRLYLQCQFYAGDSGSVSHKNVDQTSKSRQAVLSAVSNARFIEYVDGAGYFSSLNGDLKTLLSMPTTRSFVQLRSTPIRLRRELQDIGFLTPLDVAHAVLRWSGDVPAAVSQLRDEAFDDLAIERALKQAFEVAMLVGDRTKADVSPARREVVRRYLLLDVAACFGRVVDPRGVGLKGHFLVPGHGPFFGLPLDELASKAIEQAPPLRADWSSPSVILGDIRWLSQRGFAMTA